MKIQKYEIIIPKFAIETILRRETFTQKSAVRIHRKFWDYLDKYKKISSRFHLSTLRANFANPKGLRKACAKFGIILIFVLGLSVNVFALNEVEEAKAFANSGEYQKAYEKMSNVVKQLQDEVKNMEGLLQHYKDELVKVTGPQKTVDRSYNEAANSLWASAWSVQHDGVFKKTGKEKEAYLQRAVDTYKTIVIDYPYSNKAEEAQYQIGKLYYKFIKDYKRAADEFNRYIGMYPNGRFTSEAKEMLMRIEKE